MFLKGYWLFFIMDVNWCLKGIEWKIIEISFDKGVHNEMNVSYIFVDWFKCWHIKKSSARKKQHNKTLDHVLDPAFSFAEKGSLYVWGKNSHVIRPDKPSNAKFWLPFHINKGQRPIQAAFCGAWHAVALTGFPGMVFLVSCWN